MQETIRNVLLGIKAIQKEMEKSNIKNSNIDFYIQLISDNIESDLKRQKEHLDYQIEEATRNLQIIKEELKNKKGIKKGD